MNFHVQHFGSPRLTNTINNVVLLLLVVNHFTVFIISNTDDGTNCFQYLIF
jgi:hypothetical protein